MSQHYAYRKLRDYVIALILDGHVAEGEALPSVRSLAHARGVNPLTAAKAIYNLPPGTLRPVRGIGNFVAQGAVERLRAAERASFLDERWPQIRAEISRLRFTQTELLGALPSRRSDAPCETAAERVRTPLYQNSRDLPNTSTNRRVRREPK